MFNKIKKHNYKYIIILFIFIIYKILSLTDGFSENQSININGKSIVKENDIVYIHTNLCGNYSNKECNDLKIKMIDKDFIKGEKNKELEKMVLEIPENHAITITKNSKLNHLYVFISNPETHFNLIKIYDIGKDEYHLIKEINFFTYSELFFGNYDEQNSLIYVGIVTTDFSERAFLERTADLQYRKRYLLIKD